MSHAYLFHSFGNNLFFFLTINEFLDVFKIKFWNQIWWTQLIHSKIFSSYNGYTMVLDLHIASVWLCSGEGWLWFCKVINVCLFSKTEVICMKDMFEYFVSQLFGCEMMKMNFNMCVYLRKNWKTEKLKE